MTGTGRWAAALALGTLAGLAGCSGRIWLDHDSPQGIDLHWYTQEASIAEAQHEANEHCRAWGKQAKLLRVFEDTDVTTAEFACG